MNSTPCSPSSTMRLSALPPPPPIPTTFIRAFCDTVSSSSKIMAPSGDRSEEVLQPPLQRSEPPLDARALEDRKSTRLNSSHSQISYAVFCLKKKKNKNDYVTPTRMRNRK